jgi:hypothetical protein
MVPGTIYYVQETNHRIYLYKPTQLYTQTPIYTYAHVYMDVHKSNLSNPLVPGSFPRMSRSSIDQMRDHNYYNGQMRDRFFLFCGHARLTDPVASFLLQRVEIVLLSPTVNYPYKSEPPFLWSEGPRMSRSSIN